MLDLVQRGFDAYPWVESLTWFCGLLLLAWLVNALTRQVLRFLFRKRLAEEGLHNGHPSHRPETRALARFANIAPALVIMFGIGLVPHLAPWVQKVVLNVTAAVIVVTIALTLMHLLDYVNLLYLRKASDHSRPIKGYLQVVKIIVALIATLLVISALIDRSPLILLSGVGVMATVLMLVFQDTILSLVASIQISSSGLVKVGDWLEMPQVNADGDVVDIALHTVTVRNWDKTLTTFPTRKLVSDSFKNWRGMFESGGRRIKRALYLDQTSVRFLSDEEIAELQHFAVLDGYLERKQEEIQSWNQTLLEQGKHPVNTRRVTNLGTFRAYVDHYLRNHPQIHKEMTCMVRQLQPTPHGIPLELYCFTSTTAWVAYESIQADIFDHLLAVLPRFHLRVFQQPGGHDLKHLAAPPPAA